MMNLIQKMHALLVHPDIRVWHYLAKPQKGFQYELFGSGDGIQEFDTLEEMIVEAYKRIDPLLKPLPKEVTYPF